jgi:hypothetical protein
MHLSTHLYLCPFWRQQTPVGGVYEFCVGKVKWDWYELSRSVGWDSLQGVLQGLAWTGLVTLQYLLFALHM